MRQNKEKEKIRRLVDETPLDQSTTTISITFVLEHCFHSRVSLSDHATDHSVVTTVLDLTDIVHKRYCSSDKTEQNFVQRVKALRNVETELFICVN